MGMNSENKKKFFYKEIVPLLLHKNIVITEQN